MNIYDFAATAIDGAAIDFSQFRNKVILIVNTASKCGFAPQFDDLETLYQKYSGDGLIILGFPCRQFLHQEFKDDDETLNFCQQNYGVTFPMFEQINVRGRNQSPIFKYLISQAGGGAIKWNFTKFLVNRDGNVVARHEPQDPPLAFEDEIKDLLAKS